MTSTVAVHGETEAPAGRTYWLVLGLFLLLVVGVFIFASHATPPRWQYKVAEIADSTFDRTMNDFGNEGWELVTARRATNADPINPTIGYEVILKRKR